MAVVSVSRWERGVALFYWLVTLAWLVLLGRVAGGLMATPYTDVAALSVFFGGPLAIVLLQPLGLHRPAHIWLRTALPCGALAGGFADGAGPHLTVLSPWVVAGYAAVAGLAALIGTGLAVLAARSLRVSMMAHFRLSRRPQFRWVTLGAGGVMLMLARLFLWRARAERPEFDPIEYPNDYSRSMTLWTVAFLIVGALACVALFATAFRLRRQWRNEHVSEE